MDIFEIFISRKGLKKAIKRGQILLNGSVGKTGDWVRSGQEISVLSDPRKTPKILPLFIPVIYEDEHLAILHKPASIPVSGNRFRTVENALPFNLEKTILPIAMPWPRPVHRLDAATSGLLVVAKTYPAMVRLGQAWEVGAVRKKYIAIVWGKLPASAGSIVTPIDERAAQTDYEELRTIKHQKLGTISEVSLTLKTGRTHQLRKHLSSLGNDILGDLVYKKIERKKIRGLWLFATEIKFSHPITEEPLHFRVEKINKIEKLFKSVSYPKNTFSAAQCFSPQ